MTANTGRLFRPENMLSRERLGIADPVRNELLRGAYGFSEPRLIVVEVRERAVQG